MSVFLAAVVISLAAPQVGNAQWGYEEADVVCTGWALDVFSSGMIHLSYPTVEEDVPLKHSHVRVNVVLAGTVKPGDLLPVSHCWTRESPGPFYGEMTTGTHNLLALKRRGPHWAFMTSPVEVTTASQTVDAEASITDKVIALLLASLDEGHAKRSRRALLQLYGLPLRTDSPYYDALGTLSWLEGCGDQRLESLGLSARLRLNDVAALQRLLEIGRVDPESARITGGIEYLRSHDAVTTLCLIAEGKLLPERKLDALKALREIGPPAALPTLIGALDDKDIRVCYFAYTAIEKVRGQGEWMTTAREFDGRQLPEGQLRESKDEPLTPHAQMLIDQMKQWWETEGKKQFDYVLRNDQ